MRKYGKKILGIVAAATMLCSVAVTAGCGDVNFNFVKPVEVDYAGEVKSNGGFVVEKGNYVYFINGVEGNTADNTYGKVEKGALMRISKANLKAGAYSEADVVVPSLIVSKNYEAGIFIYGDYVYYATPRTDKNLQGEIENSDIDLKCANLLTGKPMEGKFLHLVSASAEYRFVEEDGTVYCLYEEDGALKSYNTKTKKNVVLVEGASDYYYDRSDPNNGNVYYTLPVTKHIASDKAKQIAEYNQLFCVNAAATVKEVGKKDSDGNISYKIEGKEADGENTYSKTYTFNAKYLEKNQDGFKAKDHSTYPYVNLGQLVLDGVGTSSMYTEGAGWFTEGNQADAKTFEGYTYTIARYDNDGVYFTRGTNNKLYYLADSKKADWDTIKGNDADTADELDIVALSTAQASANALFEVSETAGVRTHSYLFKEGSYIYKATAQENGEADYYEIIKESKDITGIANVTLWKTEGDYLYYYASHQSGKGNGNSLSRVNYKGTEEDYKLLSPKEEYLPVTLPLVDWSMDWYKPEIVDLGDGQSVVLYANAQKYGNSATAFNYVYAAKMGTTAQINANIEKYEKYTKYLNEYTNVDSQNLIKYFFSAGTILTAEEMELSQTIKDLYKDENKDDEEEQNAFYNQVVGKFTAEDGKTPELVTASEFIGLVGSITQKDKKAIQTAWADSLLKPEAKAEEDNSLPGWAIGLIIGGSAAIVLAGAGVALYFYIKKKKAEKAAAEAVVNAYRRKKIDTTDDKTINVYNDEKKEDVAEEKSEPVEETTEEPVEETSATEEAEAPANEE